MASATFKVWRGNANGGEFKEYTTELSEGMVVLDAVHQVQAEQAHDLAIRELAAMTRTTWRHSNRQSNRCSGRAYITGLIRSLNRSGTDLPPRWVGTSRPGSASGRHPR